MFTYSSRIDAPICPKLCMPMSWNEEHILERSKLRESVLGSSPAESDSCSSETKCDRRRTPKPNLVVLPRSLEERGHNSEKLSWVRVFGEDGFCSSETRHDRRKASRPKMFASKRRLHEHRLQLRKTLLDRVPARVGPVARELSTLEQRQHKSGVFRRGDSYSNINLCLYMLETKLPRWC
jgi:hypothetical protein